MKKGFTSLNLQLPRSLKAFYEREAKKLMVSTSAVIRAALAAKAKQSKTEEAEEAK